ncbi:uncharacterized protein GGS25DRAFT_520768 [Hypoxylon fragiforme]|uniref:uncharacterized protein n=1 Tax=Hypoxylon fragiforme TaxID=63214 RepID=UPI0020C7455F|nr:uncharacterized protein GGS25DRAFT_520768 [Hypoxylon fragiforme]KAI2609964.1 hypothetical protein GGS25DRAFT_520768 [Hypoxylon fragiforme]
MENKKSKEVSFGGKDIQPVTNVDNQGWSTTAKPLDIKKFQGHRAHAPEPLSISDEELEESNFPQRVTKVSLSDPAFDYGLGCFGNPTKLVETGKQELGDLFWTDFHELRTAEELREEERVWKSEEDWIRFQRLAQKNAEPKTEEELRQFWGSLRGLEKKSYAAPIRPGALEAKDFLAKLDDMEAAHSEDRTVPSTTRDHENPRLSRQNFRDWMEAADFIENNASSSSGTRYYKTSED